RGTRGGVGRASARARRRGGRRRRPAVGTGDRCRGGSAARRRTRSRGIARARPQEFARFTYPRPRGVSRRAADQTHGPGAPPGHNRDARRVTRVTPNLTPSKTPSTRRQISTQAAIFATIWDWGREESIYSAHSG